MIVNLNKIIPRSLSEEKARSKSKNPLNKLLISKKKNCDPADPNSSHESWDLISRNTQMVVSGLYYWVVETEDGSTQMGKLVIIM